LPINEPTVRANVLAAMPGFLKARGLDARSLLEEAGISAAALDDKQLQIPLVSAAKFFDLAALRSGDAAFGLSYARAFPPGGTGLLGHLIMSAPTVRDVFLVFTRYLQVHTTSMTPEFAENEGVGWFTFAWPRTSNVSMLQYNSFAMGTVILRLRLATSPNWFPLSVHFQHREPDCLGVYHEFFGTRLKFDQTVNGISVDATTLARPMPVVLEGLYDSVRDLGDRQLQEQTSTPDTSSKLQAVIAGCLATERPFDLETVAATMDMPGRALQWRLEQEGTTYEKVLLLTRILQAERYLRDSDHQLTKIASVLGFSELSAFTRWSQKQFKMTPSAFRQHLRSGGRAALSAPDDAP
jgi:AraC-like DNA-binding protein